ncbi:MAG: hypothetical protein IKL82_05710 [Clostridia bacterium]|nr:hypothetical protein [Clostridia bacterium]
MKVTNGLKIAMANKPLCYKMLFSRIIVFGLALLACWLFAGILFNPLFESNEFKALINTFFGETGFFASVLHGTFKGSEFSANLSSAVQGVFVWLGNNSSTIVWVIIAIVVVLEICRFIIGVCDYVMAVNVYEHMSSLRHAQFFTTLVEHFKPACKYGLYCIISLTLYNAVIYSLATLIAIGSIGAFGVLGVSVTILFLIIADSFRLMMVGVVPAKMVCEGCGVIKALRSALSGLKFKDMLDRFLSYFVFAVFRIATSALFAITTCGISLLISIPLFLVTNMAIRFVDYFTIKHLKYYCNYDNVVIPKELRSPEEQLLNQVDIDA